MHWHNSVFWIHQPKMPNKNTQWQYFEHQIFPNSDSVIIYFLDVYFSHIQNCIQLVITIVPKRFLWELCNRWLIHVKHILRGHCPSMTSGSVRHTTTYHSHSDVYDGSREEDSEYLGLKSELVGVFSESDVFFPTCPNVGRVSEKSVILPKTIINRKNSNA